MDNILFVIQLLLVLITVFVICALFFNVFMKIPHKHKLIYNLNHPHYISGIINPECPQGCYNKKCLYPNQCFNCREDDPYCCCYDFQCKNCI